MLLPIRILVLLMTSFVMMVIAVDTTKQTDPAAGPSICKFEPCVSDQQCLTKFPDLKNPRCILSDGPGTINMCCFGKEHDVIPIISSNVPEQMRLKLRCNYYDSKTGLCTSDKDCLNTFQNLFAPKCIPTGNKGLPIVNICCGYGIRDQAKQVVVVQQQDKVTSKPIATTTLRPIPGGASSCWLERCTTDAECRKGHPQWLNSLCVPSKEAGSPKVCCIWDETEKGK